MKENICTSCGASIPEGLQVCGVCLKKSEGPEFHQAVRTIERYCRDYRNTHKNCDDCPLKHHCQNTISQWPRLMLVSDFADYKEPPVTVKEAVERLKKSTDKWLSKNWKKVYVAIVILFSLLLIALGITIGDKCSDFKHKESSEQITESVYSTSLQYEPDWYIKLDGGDSDE